jgi:hypothetical protein
MELNPLLEADSRLHFMEFQSSLLCSQQRDKGFCPELDESSPLRPIPFSKLLI